MFYGGFQTGRRSRGCPGIPDRGWFFPVVTRVSRAEADPAVDAEASSRTAESSTEAAVDWEKPDDGRYTGTPPSKQRRVLAVA